MTKKIFSLQGSSDQSANSLHDSSIHVSTSSIEIPLQYSIKSTGNIHKNNIKKENFETESFLAEVYENKLSGKSNTPRSSIIDNDWSEKNQGMNIQ